MIGRMDAILGLFQSGARTLGGGAPGGGVLGVSEIARRTGISKPAVSRIAAELVERRFLERVEGGLRLGVRLFELGSQAAGPSDLRRLAFATLADLRSATRQTVHLAVLEGSDVVYIEILRSRFTPPLPSRVGGRLPAYATGVGKALLAHLSEERLAEVLPERLTPVGPRTIIDPAVLRRHLEEVRETGFAYEREESAPLIGCAAAPVFDADDRPIAAVSISVHLDAVDLVTLGAAVSTAAHAITRQAVQHQFRAG